MSRLAVSHPTPQSTAQRRLVIFEAPIGWVGFSHRDGIVDAVKIGYQDSEHLCADFRKLEVIPHAPDHLEQKIVNKFARYFSGQRIDFSDVKIARDHLTEFQNAVVDHCRAIPFAQTVTYGQLASIAGRPKAARAVGTVMKKNRYPIIVPCHRVVAANGLGGFSGPQGCKTKLQLQSVEKFGSVD